MAAPPIVVEISKGTLIIATIVLFGWLKWRQAKRFYGRDLGDGGVTRLFGPDGKKH